MTVSDVLLKVLAAHGVRHVFGMPGDAINDVTDAIRRQDAIRFIGVRHEETGAFAASAQAKLTGTLGACMGTAGPGAIHLLNGLYDAQLDHAPVVAVTGQVATGYIGTEYHQEIDLEKLFAGVAVYTKEVTSPEQVPAVFLEACRAALAHGGVAHIALPTDLSGTSVSFDEEPEISMPVAGRIAPDAEACREAVSLIDAARKPVVLAGIGCAGARAELVSFAEAVQAPIIRTLRAKEVIDDDHPLCIGGLGQLGGKPAVRAIDECDLLVMAGTDFPYHDFYPESARVVQIDRRPTQVGKRQRVDAALVGDAGPTLARLTTLVEQPRSPRFLHAMQAEMREWLDDQRELEASDARPIHPARVVDAVARIAPDDAVFVSDTGTVTAWTARHLRLRGGQRYTLSGGLASMAFGLPGAIGAQLAYPGRRVFALVGDGGFGMLLGDFVTAVKYELPIVVVVFNNDKLALIQMELEAKGLPDWGTGLLNPDFAAVARACGGYGASIREAGELGPVLHEALASGKPCVLDVAVDPGVLVMPPKIGAAQAVNFAKAKVREVFR